jgi:hypothetical protein
LSSPVASCSTCSRLQLRPHHPEVPQRRASGANSVQAPSTSSRTARRGLEQAADWRINMSANSGDHRQVVSQPADRADPVCSANRRGFEPP